VPKFAASNHTNAVPMPSAVRNNCARVSWCSAAAAGTPASSTAAATAQATIIFLRFRRSAIAPASSPNTRYGTAWTAVSAATAAGEPVSP